MPLGARTTPSRRSVLTSKPRTPGGRGPELSLPLPPSWPIMEANGSRRAMIGRAGPGMLPLGVPAEGFFSTGFFATAVPLPLRLADFAAGFSAGFLSGAAAWVPGLAAGACAGFAAGVVGLAAWGAGLGAGVAACFAAAELGCAVG